MESKKITIRITKVLDKTPSITVEDDGGSLIDWKCSKCVSDKVKNIISHSNRIYKRL